MCAIDCVTLYYRMRNAGGVAEKYLEMITNLYGEERRQTNLTRTLYTEGFTTAL